MEWLSYSDAMGEAHSFLTVTLDLAEPIEISDFAAFFAGLGCQFDDYLRTHYPDLKGTAKLYVREVRHGSIIADLVPIVRDIIGLMDDVIIVKGFIDLFKFRLHRWQHGTTVPDITKDDIKHMSQAIRAVAHDKDGTARIERIHYVGGREHRELEVTFTTSQAREAIKTIEGQKREMEALPAPVDHERVLMRFTRSDVLDAEIGKRSGELVVIEDVSDRPLPLIYGSDLAEQRIKDETRNPDSIFYKGFVVDVNVQMAGGRRAAYTVKNVHQVIDLPTATGEDQ
jgi:hypothetical protein